jgi:hypothetical protein
MRVRAYSPFWWVLAGTIMLVLMTSCSDVTEMRQVPTEAQYAANLKANGINYGGLGTCDPGTRGTVADVNLCFIALFRALAFSGAAIGTCGAAAAGASTVGAAIGAWSVCGIAIAGTGDYLGRYVEATDIGRWANQSAEEIANRMRQVIYERMVKRGLWDANAGCC